MVTDTVVRSEPSADTARDVVAGLGSILGVWAHPDDEVYLSAGLMRLALESGHRVACVTATFGELGTPDPDRWPPSKLRDIRRLELDRSLATLGGIRHSWLGHPDGGCADIPVDVGAGQVGEMMDRYLPDTVVTFEPGGVTGHPDHRAVAAWVARALETRPLVRCWEACVPSSWIEAFATVLDLQLFFEAGYPTAVADDELALRLVCDDRLWRSKEAALRAHATQVEPAVAAIGEAHWAAWCAGEFFRERQHGDRDDACRRPRGHRPPPPRRGEAS